MRRDHVIFCGVLILFFIFSFVAVGIGYTLIFTGLSLLFLHHQNKDYRDTDKTERRKSVDHLNSSNVNRDSDTAGESNLSLYVRTGSNRDTCDSHSGGSVVQNLLSRFVFETPVAFSNMWENRVRSPVGMKAKGTVRLNTTMPALSTSPMLTRQRNTLNGSANNSFANSPSSPNGRLNSTMNGPLLSSPFMPQIRRALGLEPSGQSKYRYVCNYLFEINVVCSPTSTSVD